MNRKPKIRLVVGDHHPLARLGLAHILDAQPDFAIVASCENGLECLKAIREHAPDVALIELDLPGLHGLEVLAAATAEQFPTRIVVFANSVEDIEIVAAAASGAYGIILKDAPPDELVESLRAAAAGQKVIPNHIHRKVHGTGEHAPGEPPRYNKVLTHREQTVLLLVAHGMSNKEIARRLHLAEGTVKVHVHNIFQKLGVNRRTALARLVGSRRTTD